MHCSLVAIFNSWSTFCVHTDITLTANCIQTNWRDLSPQGTCTLLVKITYIQPQLNQVLVCEQRDGKICSEWTILGRLQIGNKVLCGLSCTSHSKVMGRTLGRQKATRVKWKHGHPWARFAKERQKVPYEFRVRVNRVAEDKTGKVDKYSLPYILHQCFKWLYDKKLIFFPNK